MHAPAGKFFGRKFDTMMDAKVLDLIDLKLLSHRDDAMEEDHRPGGGGGGKRVIVRTVS